MASQINWINNDVIVTYSETLTMNCFKFSISEILSKPTFNIQKFQINDFLNIKDVDISETELKMLGSMDRNATRWNDHLLLALIFAKEQEHLANLYLEFVKDTKWEVKMFNNLEDAKKWLKSRGCIVEK